MHDKYDPIKLSIIIILGFIFFVAFGIIYNNATRRNTWLICELSGNYNEKIKIKYVDDIMERYYREEYFKFKSKSDLETYEKHFNEEREKLTLSNDFKYNIEVDGFNLTVKTYIQVKKHRSFFDQYSLDLNFSSDSDVSSVKKVLEGKEYKCSIKKN